MYPELTKDRSWYSVGLPLHYPSTFAGRATEEDLDEYILAELLDRAIGEFLPPGPFHLVGYSVGGLTALNYAAKFPTRVRSVVSIGGFVTGRTGGLEGVLEYVARGNFLRKALFRTGYWIMQRHRIFYKLATLTYARRWGALLRYPALDATIRNVFADVRHHSIAGQRAWFRYLLGMNINDELTAVRCPVLVAAGTADPVIPYAHQEEYAAALPNATLLRLEGVGHVPFAEAPERFRAALLEWFAA